MVTDVHGAALAELNYTHSLKTGVPESKYSKVPPSAYRSEAGCAAPLNCSGAMYPYVPARQQ